ncbi:MAG: bifunctional demethylmenaquinone methyltransferase/2-methoxy-6-polyprenyl-1,4-benzoquinol methylase [Bacteroidetes bacterium 4572_128]|nr:MAG: bifunctional demethylmenaquinone methyltransferase/2-methoxy-6-polyprenyl-1,4-benzoquinol methylase [Bacteroidetes bacterium 4572_128]
MIKPYKNSYKSKKEQVAFMFDNISSKYDFLNHLFSFGIDKIWRNKLINLLRKNNHKIVLDLATGTGDLAIKISKLKVKKIIGIDISKGMLNFAEKKIKNKNLENIISFELGDAEKIKFENNYFDAITIAFGVRNFENLEIGLQEMFRVLKKNGKVFILEFSKAKKFPVKQIYNFYFSKIIPFLGKKISKDNSAYDYLYSSVEVFPEGNKFLEKLNDVGFKNCKQISLNFGIASIYVAEKF